MSFELDERAQSVLTHIVDAYMADGQPVGSRTLTRVMEEKVSAATIRNVMQDLEYAGLIHSPHTSAGRLPTREGLRFFVDGLMTESPLSDLERKNIDAQCRGQDMSIQDVFEQTSRALSGLSSCAGMVLVPKREAPLRQIQFLHIETGKALAVLVFEDGDIQNRLLDVPPDIHPSSLQQATNYLQDKLFGKTLSELTHVIQMLEKQVQTDLDDLTAKVVKAGVAIQPAESADLLIVQGAHTMLDPRVGADIEEIRRLYDLLEKQDTASHILQQTMDGDGVQIFIGAENRTFQSENLSMVVSTYRDENRRIIGATGVIGPTHLNYRRVVPLVDYTAQVMGRVIGLQR